MNQLPCVKNYFKNPLYNGAQFSVRTFNQSDDGLSWSSDMPYPFLILGSVDKDGLPQDSSIVYPNSRIFLSSTAVQSTYSQMWQALFISMMYANRDYGRLDGTFPLPATEYSKGKLFYPQYFNNFLNNQLIDTNYSTFIMPLNEIIQFWEDENATPVPSTLWGRLRMLSSSLFNTSDRQMWGAPGKYIIHSPSTLSSVKRLQIPNSFQGGNKNLITSQKIANWLPFQNANAPEEDKIPAPLNQSKNVYLWVYRYDGTEQETIYGSKEIPAALSSTVFTSGNDGNDIRDFINAFFIGSADTNLTIFDIIAGVAGYSSDNPVGFNPGTYWYGMSSLWTGGAYTFPVLPAGQYYGLGVGVSYEDYAVEPYWTGFSEYNANFSPINLLTLEYKPTE